MPDPDVRSLGEHSWLHERGDGLLRVSDRTRVSVDMNVRQAMNAHAARSPGLSMTLPDEGGAVIDTFFGRAYTGLPVDGSAVYGHTAALRGSLDGLADPRLGFLRVPFKRIPRTRAANLDEVRAVVRAAEEVYGADRLLFRGQHAEWLLRRSPAFCQRFYGDDSPREPSLTPSSSRRSPAIEDCMAEFMMWVQLWQETTLNRGAPVLARRLGPVFDDLARSVQRTWQEPRFYFHALALAQHYGMPTVGLDVTDDPGVALFFALNEAVKSGEEVRFHPVPPTAAPVLYILLREGSREHSFRDSAPLLFHSGRPMQQRAWFMHVGWGLARNTAAEQIVAAVYLDPSARYGDVPAPRDLFPSRDEDVFGAYLSSLAGAASATLSAVLSDIYWIEDGDPAG